MFYLTIAGLTVRIEHRYSFVRTVCTDYLASRQEENSCICSIRISGEEIELQKARAIRLGRRLYPDWYYENIALQRRLCQELLCHGALFVHSALLSIDGSGYALAAPVHGGKSTQASLWLRAFPGRASLINGDKPVYRMIDGQLIGFGTPWMGKEASGRNACVPVRTFFFIKKGEKEQITPLSGEEILRRIFYHLELPEGDRNIAAMEQILADFIRAVPFFEMECTLSKDAPKAALKAASHFFSDLQTPSA